MRILCTVLLAITLLSSCSDDSTVSPLKPQDTLQPENLVCGQNIVFASNVKKDDYRGYYGKYFTLKKVVTADTITFSGERGNYYTDSDYKSNRVMSYSDLLNFKISSRGFTEFSSSYVYSSLPYSTAKYSFNLYNDYYTLTFKKDGKPFSADTHSLTEQPLLLEWSLMPELHYYNAITILNIQNGETRDVKAIELRIQGGVSELYTRCKYRRENDSLYYEVYGRSTSKQYWGSIVLSKECPSFTVIKRIGLSAFIDGSDTYIPKSLRWLDGDDDENGSNAVQCTGKTQKNERCKNKTTCPNQRCYLHEGNC